MPRLMLATLDAAALLKTLQSHAAALRYIYLESETRVVLAPFSDYLSSPSPWPRVRWLNGRAFGPNLEIRWHQEDLIIELQALSETDNAPQGWLAGEWNTQFDPEAQPRRVLLAGVNSALLPQNHVLHSNDPQSGLWVSPTMARPLKYPIGDPSAARVMLSCLDYCVNGIVVLTRLVDLIPYTESE